MTEREPRRHDPEHLAWLRTQPCAICGDDTTVEAAHLRVGSINDDKRESGLGEKPSDKWTVPLCGRHHREQHSMNELEFWLSHGIDDPFALAMRYARRQS